MMGNHQTGSHRTQNKNHSNTGVVCAAGHWLGGRSQTQSASARLNYYLASRYASRHDISFENSISAMAKT